MILRVDWLHYTTVLENMTSYIFFKLRLKLLIHQPVAGKEIVFKEPRLEDEEAWIISQSRPKHTGHTHI